MPWPVIEKKNWTDEKLKTKFIAKKIKKAKSLAKKSKEKDALEELEKCENKIRSKNNYSLDQNSAYQLNFQRALIYFRFKKFKEALC